MKKFGVWLATSPLGSASKAATGAVLVWILDNISTFELPAYVQVAIIAGLPVIINYLNVEDTRYGKESDNVSE